MNCKNYVTFSYNFSYRIRNTQTQIILNYEKYNKFWHKFSNFSNHRNLDINEKL